MENALKNPRTTLYLAMIWLTVMGIIYYELYVSAINRVDSINFHFKTMEEILNGNP